MSLTQSQIEKKLSNENLDELLDLWRTEQGAEKRRDLDLMAAAIPFSKDATLRVLDLCCGPGDVGRAVRARYPKSQIDCLDRDVFLISICLLTNRREGISGQSFVRDLWEPDWCRGLERDYDMVATANALHWLDARRVFELCKDVFRLLRPGGVFLFVDPPAARRRSPPDSPNGSRGSRAVTAERTGNGSGAGRTKFLVTTTRSSWAREIRI